MAIQLITEAVKSGARSPKACGVLVISCRTLRRLSEAGHGLRDRRGQATRGSTSPAKALTQKKSKRLCKSATPLSTPACRLRKSCLAWRTRGSTWPLSRVFTGCSKSTAKSTAEAKRTVSDGVVISADC
jgi:hypothetical protein